MSIKVRYFASLREQIGREEEDMDSAGIKTAADVWDQASSEPMPVNTLVAINMEYGKSWDLVNDGDEVAFFPPVTGG